MNVVTAAPKTDKYSASGNIEYGSYSLGINDPRTYGAVFSVRF